jgi:uncharacterized short protein YbdD (DUF466 family)
MLRSRRLRVEAAANAEPVTPGRPVRRLQAVALLFVALCRACARAARLAIGIPDYDAYVAHLGERHPGRQPMDREAFFRERMLARYGRGRSRCC